MSFLEILDTLFLKSLYLLFEVVYVSDRESGSINYCTEPVYEFSGVAVIYTC